MILSNDKPIEALRIDERTHVEDPLLEQLDKQGWTVLRLERKQTPQDSFRANFGQVVLLPTLEETLRKINPFLREEQVAEVVRKITSFPQKNLIENNRQVVQFWNIVSIQVPRFNRAKQWLREHGDLLETDF